MSDKAALLQEAEAIRAEFALSTSQARQTELKRRYEEIERQLRRGAKPEPNSDMPLQESRHVKLKSAEGEASLLLGQFPQRKEPHRPVSAASEWRRFILPLILIGIVAIVMGMSWYQHPSQKSDKNRDEPSALLSPTDHVTSAESLKTEGDEHWTKGFNWWNDRTELHSALISYQQAWKEITGKDWDNSNKDSVKTNTIIDAANVRKMRDEIAFRIPELEKALNGYWLLR